MDFPFINTQLEILDSLELNSVQMKLTYKDHIDSLSELVVNYFPSVKTKLQDNQYHVSIAVPLTDNGKKTIKTLANELKTLDQQFEKRVGLVDEFKNLLGE